MVEDVPLVYLFKVFSATIYSKSRYIFNFEVSNHKTSITMTNFCRLLGLVTPKISVDRESIPATYLIEMFYQMGYIGDIFYYRSSVNPFCLRCGMGCLPFCSKAYQRRVLGSDSTNKLFYTLIYGLYHVINLEFGSVIWAQFVQSTTSSTRHTKISCACFWSIIVNRAISHFKVPLIQDSLMDEIPTLQTTTFVMSDPHNFDFVGSIPDALLEKVSLDKAIIRAYREMPSSCVRPIPAEL